MLKNLIALALTALTATAAPLADLVLDGTSLSDIGYTFTVTYKHKSHTVTFTAVRGPEWYELKLSPQAVGVVQTDRAVLRSSSAPATDLAPYLVTDWGLLPRVPESRTELVYFRATFSRGECFYIAYP